jgi:hypothetical protein
MLQQEPDQREPAAESSARDLDDWEFGPPETTNSPTASTPGGNARREGAARGETGEEALEKWEFERASDGTSRANRSQRSTASGESLTLEERLAPIVGLVVVGSLLLSGGYIFVVTVW